MGLDGRTGDTLYRVYGADGTLLLAGWDGREVLGLARAIASEHVTRVVVTSETVIDGVRAERQAVELECPDVGSSTKIVPRRPP